MPPERGVVLRTKEEILRCVHCIPLSISREYLPDVCENVWGGIFMITAKKTTRLQKIVGEGRLTPWKVIRLSALEMTDLVTVCVMAIMLAACYVFGMLTIPLMGQALQVKFSFLIYSVSGVLYGPVPTAILGVCDQIFVETLMKGNGILPGYIISFAIRGLIYGFFLYYPTAIKKGMSVPRFALLKATDTVFNNIVMNTYLNFHYGFISAGSLSAAMAVRIGKNIILLPLEVFLLCVFMSAMLRALPRIGVMPQIRCSKITGKHIIALCVLAAVGIGLLIAYIAIPSFREVLKFGLQ